MTLTAADPTLSADQMEVLGILYDIADPELGVNVVDLGLVRGITLTDLVAHITMTLTTPACPLTDELEDEVRAQLRDAGVARDTRIEWVFMPPWKMSDMTPEGRDQLRALGF